MAHCGCAGATCGCLLVAGEGIAIEGVGSSGFPFTISATAILDISNHLTVTDTDTVNLTLSGDGTVALPFILSADATLTMSDLADVDDAGGPSAGDVPTWVGNGGGHWEFQPPTATGVAVVAEDGLEGDGTAPNPLVISNSGTWGSGVLSGWGVSTTAGDPVYVDINGQIRSGPPSFQRCTAATRPVAYQGLRIYETDTQRSYIGNGTTFTLIPDAAAGGSGAMEPTLTTVGGTQTWDSSLVDTRGLHRLTLSSNSVLTIPDGESGLAYEVYLVVPATAYTLSINGTAITGLSSTLKTLVTCVWTGLDWFVTWPAR